MIKKAIKFIRKGGRIIPINPDRINKVYNAAGKKNVEAVAKAISHKGKGKAAVNKAADIAHGQLNKISKLKAKNDNAIYKAKANLQAASFVGAGLLTGSYLKNKKKKK